LEDVGGAGDVFEVQEAIFFALLPIFFVFNHLFEELFFGFLNNGFAR